MVVLSGSHHQEVWLLLWYDIFNLSNILLIIYGIFNGKQLLILHTSLTKSLRLVGMAKQTIEEFSEGYLIISTGRRSKPGAVK